jgi:hypothetical protein
MDYQMRSPRVRGAGGIASKTLILSGMRNPGSDHGLGNIRESWNAGPCLRYDGEVVLQSQSKKLSALFGGNG